MINWIKKGNIGKFFGDALHKLIFHSSAKFGKFDTRNVISFQIKNFGRNLRDYARDYARKVFHKK